MKKLKKMKKGLVLLSCLILIMILCPVQTRATAKIKLNKTNTSIYIGDTITLKVSGTAKKITWSSSDTSVASVNTNGKVTGKSAGKTTIKAKTGRKTLKCTVRVNKVLAVDKTSMTIQENGNVTVTYKMDGHVLCEVDDSNIISCEWDNGDWVDDSKKLHITGLKNGTANITITNTYNKEKIKIKVTVVKGIENDDSSNNENNSNVSSDIPTNYRLLSAYLEKNGTLNTSGGYFINWNDGGYEYLISYHSSNDKFILGISNYNDNKENGLIMTVNINPINYYNAYMNIDFVAEDDLGGFSWEGNFNPSDSNIIISLDSIYTEIDELLGTNLNELAQNITNSALDLLFVETEEEILKKAGLSLADLGLKI